MKLEELLSCIKVTQYTGNKDLEILGLEIDSRNIKPGYLFIAIKGNATDGHAFIDKAIANGACAVLCMDLPEQINPAVTYVQVADTEDAVGRVATHFYGNPTSKMKLIGVTGTNGKTTIATLLFHMFKKMGYKCGLCSTVCNYIQDEAIPTSHTTPDPITLNQLLGRMADEGCAYAFMEVSSHAVAQKRIGGLTFAGGIFTNLTRDHLDYHKTFENYRDAKKAFFDQLPKEAFAITNADDKNGMVMVQNTAANIKTYSMMRMADFCGKILEESFDGMYLSINDQEVSVPFIGRFNVYNLLAVYAATVMLGKDPMNTLVTLSTLRPVNGRFETIRSKNGVTAIVDYAHTPDALVNVLNTINDIVKGRNSVITVCGAGGNRDKGKRPIMAREAADHSDRVIITSDNPRFENPEDIIKDMTDGLSHEQAQKVITITNRKEAIKAACMMAQTGDVILVAGKGHENYQEIEGVKHHFDDHEVIKECFGVN